jgi:nicotinamide-nucleotide amidase
LCAQEQQAGAASPQKTLDYSIVVTGGELLRGVYPDAHTAFLARTLLPLGFHCLSATVVDDHKPDIEEALRFAGRQARLVIVTGGLGPTSNDISREVLADFTGISLREHPEVLAEMERRFNTSKENLRVNLRRQTLVPTRGTWLRNPQGTAVGLVFEQDQRLLVALPGPPRELQPMVVNELVPYLRRRFGISSLGCSLTLRFVGVGQSQIDQTLRENGLAPPEVMVGSTFEGGRVDFTFSLRGDSPEERNKLAELGRRIREHLGGYCYAQGSTTLEEHVLSLLAERGATLALAEVGSGGTLAASLQQTQAARQLLLGAYSAPTETMLRQMLGIGEGASAKGLSGADLAKLFGEAAAKLTKARCAFGVGPVTQNEKSAAGLWFAFRRTDGRWNTQWVELRGTGEVSRLGLVTTILDRIRKQL